MKTCWSIGKRWIEAEVDAMMLTVRVDEEVQKHAVVAKNILGEWPIKVGKRDARIRRVRNLDVARTELWVAGVRIPPTSDPIVRRKPQPGETCKPHPGTGGDYRSAGPPPAKIACGVCRTPLCADCIAADAVRCKECFDRAAAALVVEERSQRIKGPIIAFALCIAFILVGFAVESGKVVGLGASAFLLTAFRLGIGYYREQKEVREKQRDARD